MWTKEHDIFALENKLSPAAILLWKWLIRKGCDKQLEPDLLSFNQWVERSRGKGYCNRTLKDALQKLIDCGVVKSLRRFCWKIHKLIVFSLEKFFQNQKPISKTQDRNALKSNVHKFGGNTAAASSRSSVEEIKPICDQHGILFAFEFLRYSVEEFKRAISLFHQRGGFQRITNPTGWLIDCLRFKWAREQDFYNELAEELLKAADWAAQHRV